MFSLGVMMIVLAIYGLFEVGYGAVLCADDGYSRMVGRIVIVKGLCLAGIGGFVAWEILS